LFLLFNLQLLHVLKLSLKMEQLITRMVLHMEINSPTDVTMDTSWQTAT